MKNDASVRWSNDLYDLAIELEKICDNLCNFAFALDTTQPVYGSIEDYIISKCNHIDRIVADMKSLDNKRDRQRITETVTKTMYL